MTLLMRLLLTLATLSSVALAASPTSFCKCTCFTNSTIIPLDAHTNDPPSLKRDLHFSRSPEDQDDAQEPVPDPPLENGNEDEGKEDKDKGKGKGEDENTVRKEYRAGNCNDCNRQFCLDYNLPICKKAGMEDVFTTCFQRDSRKDEAVVFIFIIATVGLLAWAAVRPWVSKWVDTARERRSYIPVASGDT